MDVIVSRLESYLKEKKITVKQCEVSIGASNGTLRKAFKNGTGIQSKWMSKIAEIYTDLSMEWLVRGLEPMIKDNIVDYKRGYEMALDQLDIQKNILDQQKFIIKEYIESRKNSSAG